MSDSRVVIEKFESKVLQGNYLGDPAARRVGVYLPPVYDASDLRFPVVYLLAGLTGRGTMMLNEVPWGENIQQRLDRLIASGIIQPLIVVLPDCFTRYGGSQYINSLGTGRYEDHVIDELVPWVDATFRTRAARGFRAIAGKSSGGFGALTLGARHPELFGAVACHSGDMYFEFCYAPDVLKFLRAVKKFGGVEKFIAEMFNITPRQAEWHDMMGLISMASCYSPSPASPYGFDLPFDLETGEWRKDVWARWKQWDPIELVDQYADALRSLRLLYLDCGTRDEFNLQYGARLLTLRLRERGIPYHHEEFDDGHFDIQYRYDVSFKAISEAFGH